MAAEESGGRDEAQAGGEPKGVEMPKPTIWPFVAALGLMLLAAGLVTSLAFTAVGAVMFIAGMAGWIGQLAPGVGTRIEAYVPEQRRYRLTMSPKERVARIEPGRPGYRAHIPKKVHPYRAGLKGGAVGGVVMAAIALLYGLISGRGIWYPVNLLAAMVLQSFNQAPIEHLQKFSLAGLIMGLGIHAFASFAIGFILAVIMPMIPSRQLLWGSLVAPLFWTGVVYGFMGVLNPTMNGNVQWVWFIGSQFAYGFAAVLVILRSERIDVDQTPGSRLAGQSA